MALTKEEAGKLLQQRGYDLSKLQAQTQVQPQPMSTFEEFVLRPVARAGRTTAKGLASLGDLANLPVNAALGFAGMQPLQSPSELVGQAIDSATNNYAAPQNDYEQVFDTAGEFLTGMLPFMGAAKVANGISQAALSGLSPKTGVDLLSAAGAGAGMEAFNQAFPENPVAPLVGSLAGGFAPSAAIGAKNLVKNALPTYKSANSLANLNLEEALPTKAAAERLGFQATPAEASGDPFIAAKQGTLGTSEKGGLKLAEYGKSNRDKQVGAIQGLLGDISETSLSNLSPDERIRSISQRVIEKEKNALQAKAEPLYKKAESQIIDPKTVRALIEENGTIEKAFKNVLKDPDYKTELKGFSPYSTKVLDLVKRNIDDQISVNMRAGESNKARLLTNAKSSLVDIIDKFNPTYKEARTVYSEGAPSVKAIEESPLGKIAERKDLTIKNIGKDIFDKQQTNPNVFKDIRDRVYKEDPESWNAIVRQEMERKIGSANDGGSNFYRKVLKDDKTYEQFSAALANNKNAQNKLADMRLAFKNLIEPVTAKTAASQAKSSLNVSRSTAQFIKNMLDNVLGGRYDKAAIELITDPKWDERLTQIKSLKNPEEKALEFNGLLSNIARQSANSRADVIQDDFQEESVITKPMSKEDAAKMLQERGYDLQTLEKRNTSEGNPSNNISQIINSSAAQAGLNPEFVQKVAQVESGMNPNARNPNSSASGLFQFTNSTWREVVNKYGKEYGINVRDKNNPQANAQMASLYLRDNANKLARILGREPSRGEVYASHFLGFGGANKLIKNYGKGQIAASLFPREAKANRSVFYQNGRPITVEELYNYFSKQMT